jgi:hypothetical protein
MSGTDVCSAPLRHLGVRKIVLLLLFRRLLYNHQGRARGNATAKPTTNCKQVRLTRKLFSPENPFAQLKMKAKIHLFVHRMHT